MKYIIKNKSALFTLLLGFLFFSCQDDQWDKHYDRDNSLPNENLYELIQQDADLSKFAQMIEISGYKDLLASTQSLTVWAPVNSTLEDVDLTDVAAVRTLVGNHIARFNISSSTPVEQSVKMVNRKVYHFTNDGGLNFGGSLLLAKDKLAHNGVLHKVNSNILYFNNLYEYLGASENTSKVWNFLSSFTEEIIDEELSTPIGVDENGLTIYDTVMISYNPLLKELGAINLEDSVYTMILPTNKAWDSAYDRISPYFKVYNANKTYADSVQKSQTSLAIVSDLIYRTPVTLPSSLDSIVSTSGSVIYDVNDLFSGSIWKMASNGSVYQTDELRYKNVETWNKKIDLEAELQLFRDPGVSTVIETIYPEAIGVVSGNSYIEVKSLTSGTTPSVNFSIPNVLSGKYDIYVVFVPGDMIGNPKDSTRIQFDMAYLGADGRIKDVSSNAKVKTMETSGTKMVKMKAFSQFQFPISNYFDLLWWENKESSLEVMKKRTTTVLTIMPNVTTVEVNSNKFSRKFYVDKIIFEPVRD